MHQFKKQLAVNNINGGTQKTSLEFHSKVVKNSFATISILFLQNIKVQVF